MSEDLPEVTGEFRLVETSDEQTVWRRVRTPQIGERKDEVLVFQQYGGWRVKRRYNVGVSDNAVGGYRYIDASDARATFDERREAERQAVEELGEITDGGNSHE